VKTNIFHNYDFHKTLREQKTNGLEVTAQDQLQNSMEERWHITSSECIECLKCVYFADECTANHSEMCPAVIEVFNLDGKTLQ